MKKIQECEMCILQYTMNEMRKNLNVRSRTVTYQDLKDAESISGTTLLDASQHWKDLALRQE